MSQVRNVASSVVLAMILSGGVAVAQDHHDDHDRDNHHYVHHQEWKKNATMKHEDWDRGERIEWKEKHLKRPPEGFEWRMIDGNYVMAEGSSGRISTVVVVH
jgi:Ni/Co efflux regulator RcnB